ncbi:hypothetical protein AB0I94_13935 [Streptomyces sp. NPDC050147]
MELLGTQVEDRQGAGVETELTALQVPVESAHAGQEQALFQVDV